MTNAGADPEPIYEWRRDGYLISTARDRIDFGVAHGFLTTAYWSPGITRDCVERAGQASVMFGVYSEHAAGSPMIGYARVLTDYVYIGFLHDVFIREAERGKGLSKFLMESILAHPALQTLRGWMLRTRDAHGLYARFGFVPLKDDGRSMVRPGGRI